jgi:hypothetical protein
MCIKNKLSGHIETTFLNGDLDEEIFIQAPKGLLYLTEFEFKDKILKRNKSFYAFV